MLCGLAQFFKTLQCKHGYTTLLWPKAKAKAKAKASFMPVSNKTGTFSGAAATAAQSYCHKQVFFSQANTLPNWKKISSGIYGVQHRAILLDPFNFLTI